MLFNLISFSRMLYANIIGYYKTTWITVTTTDMIVAAASRRRKWGRQIFPILSKLILNIEGDE
ncbi:hypothetical protein C7R92_23910 [Brevibacillus porteri]|uniref:Uncharacterized protein n=1 Tax=Brevibacillus porteri TaxID=2126350 RepID=A0ABX5FJI1_9BACL|nr:hypothetical protein C7R92_23910 [Brevibacillus porteri]